MGFDSRIPASSPPPAPPSLAQRLRSSICPSCCVGGGVDDEDGVKRPTSLVSSSVAWLRLKVVSRCGSLAARIGRHPQRNHHRARASGDFAYDPLSYALNFDEGHEEDGAPGGREEFRYRSFSSRLPPSPLCTAPAAG